MKLVDQVCTLEQAKRLKALGVKQNHSYAGWLRDEIFEETEFKLLPAGGLSYASPTTKGFAAFTSAELEDMLLAYFFIGHAFKSGEKWGHTWGHQKNGGNASQPIMSWHSTAARARAEMLIHLLQNDSLSASQVNERLTEKNS